MNLPVHRQNSFAPVNPFTVLNDDETAQCHTTDQAEPIIPKPPSIYVKSVCNFAQFCDDLIKDIVIKKFILKSNLNNTVVMPDIKIIKYL